jgi:pilus assembly protein CpaB
MSPVRVIIVVIAAVAAIGLAFVMRGAFGSKPAPVTAPVVADRATIRVLTAKRDLAIGDRIQGSDIGWQDWPADSLNPAFITDGAPPATPSEQLKGVAKAAVTAGEVIGGGGAMQSYIGAIVREPILTGEPLVARKVVLQGEGGFLSVVLEPGKRAVSVPVNVDSGVGGFVLPGDRVDVLLSQEMEFGDAAPGAVAGVRPKNVFASETVLTNIRVLAIDQTTEATKGAKSLIGSTATLEVGPGDAELLMRAKSQGNLVLALRSLTDAGGPSGRAVRNENAPAANMVRVHRGGSVETVGVRP